MDKTLKKIEKNILSKYNKYKLSIIEDVRNINIAAINVNPRIFWLVVKGGLRRPGFS